jgi:hypothetical protein
MKQADKSEMETDNGSHGEQSSGPARKPLPSVRTYRELQRRLRKDLLAQHPERIDADGSCPTCKEYDRRFAELISILDSQAKLRPVKKPTREKE